MNNKKIFDMLRIFIDFIALLIVLFTCLQKTFFANESFSLWLEKKEEAYGQNLFVAKAQRKAGQKILLITFNLEDAGAPLMFLYLAQSLHKKGYNVSVLSYAGGRHEKDLKRANIPYLISKKLYDGTTEAKKLFSSFDVIISGRIPKVYFPSLEYKFIWWDHGLLDCLPKILLPKEEQRNDPSLRDLSFIMSQAKDVVFVSPLQQQKLAACRKLPSEVIHNGILPTTAKSSDPIIKNIQKAKKAGKIVFVTVGSVDLIKGHDILINAVKLLEDPYRKKAAFFIVGKEKNEKYAKFLHKKSKDMPEIIWAGPIMHEKIGGIYESADVLLVPSRSDTAPLVVQEAAEHYMPSVITDNVGSTFITKDGQSGFVIPTENPKALAEKIRFFIDNPDSIEKFGKISRQNYEEYSSFDVFISKWEDKIQRKLKDLNKKNTR